MHYIPRNIRMASFDIALFCLFDFKSVHVLCLATVVQIRAPEQPICSLVSLSSCHVPTNNSGTGEIWVVAVVLGSRK